VESIAKDAPLTKSQKIAYGVLMVGGQYTWTRANRYITEKGWGELDEVSVFFLFFVFCFFCFLKSGILTYLFLYSCRMIYETKYIGYYKLGKSTGKHSQY
jgi:hypothetical protein